MFARSAFRSAIAATRSQGRSFVRNASTIGPRMSSSSMKAKYASFGVAVTAASVASVVYNNESAVARCEEEAILVNSFPVNGIPGTNQERTFLAVKPDGVQRALIGDIISRFEKRGYKLVGLKMVWPTLEMAQAHYADLSQKKVFPWIM